MAYSHSQLKLARDCGQKWKWQYQHRVKERPSANSRPLVLGSAVHAGIEAALRARTERKTLTMDGLVQLGRMHAMEYVAGETQPNVTKPNSAGTQVYNSDYYDMMREVGQTAAELVRWYFPRIPETWRIATKREVIPERYENDSAGDELALEWTIFHDFATDEEQEAGIAKDFTGVIDAVIMDTKDNTLKMVDWKVKGQPSYEDAAMIDGQMPLYAAILNHYGARIREVVMFQMRSEGPARAELGQGQKNKGKILTGRDSYATVWEVWADSLPFGVDPEKYRLKMEPKMKTWDYFIKPVAYDITSRSSTFALSNARMTIDMIEAGHLPAKLDSYACGFCPFRKLCDIKVYGGNLDAMIDMAFTRS